MNLLTNLVQPVLAQYANDLPHIRIESHFNHDLCIYQVTITNNLTRRRVGVQFTQGLIEDATWGHIDRMMRRAVENVNGEDTTTRERTFEELPMRERTFEDIGDEFFGDPYRNVAMPYIPMRDHVVREAAVTPQAREVPRWRVGPPEAAGTPQYHGTPWQRADPPDVHRPAHPIDELIIETLTLMLKRFLINESQHRGAVDLIKQGDYRNAVQVMKSINSGDFI